MESILTSLAPLIVLALALLLCRPYLEAARPIASAALLAGALLGWWPAASFLFDRGLLEAALALGGGWLAILAAEPWDLASLRRAGPARRLAHLAPPALVIGALALLPQATAALRHQPSSAGFLLYPFLILACASGALDPEAARASLGRAARPDAAARLAPTVAGLGLGAALLAAAAVWGVQAVSDPYASPSPRTLALRALGAPALGAAMGTIYVGALRLAQGRGLLQALLLSAPLACWGASRWAGVSPLAAAFACGLVLANDAARRDLVFTLLREMERPLTLALLLAAGALLPAGQAVLGSGTTWMMAAVLLLARPVAGRLAGPAGLTPDLYIPLSPLAVIVPLSMLPVDVPRWRLLDQAAVATAACFAGAELIGMAAARRAGPPRGEASR